jgi:SAM-dependent methyltransferase
MSKRKEIPWQLRMYRRSLKKKLKVKALSPFIGTGDARRCLLLTCGDNNGAINHHLRALGGEWSWAEFEGGARPEMEALLGAPVLLLDREECRLPFPDGHFDLLVSIDVHEHLRRPELLAAEFLRVLTPGGRAVVTTPNGDERKPVVRLKRWSGMSNLEYGHVRTGYTIPQLEELLAGAGLRPLRSGSYAKFFTEFLELAINWAYVKVLQRGRPGAGITPSTRERLDSVKKTYRLYALLYPFFWVFSQLDRLLFFTAGYAVIVEAQKTGKQ